MDRPQSGRAQGGRCAVGDLASAKDEISSANKTTTDASLT
jgi:hypothetical protein